MASEAIRAVKAVATIGIAEMFSSNGGLVHSYIALSCWCTKHRKFANFIVEFGNYGMDMNARIRKGCYEK